MTASQDREEQTEYLVELPNDNAGPFFTSVEAHAFGLYEAPDDYQVFYRTKNATQTEATP